MDGNYLLTMQGKNGIRIWVHDNMYRIQKRKQPMPDRNGNPQEVWESHQENGRVKLFEKWQDAEQYISENSIV